MEWMEIIGFIVGVLGLVYAFYQGTERRKLQGFVRSQNWHLYSKANNANGALQRAINIYKDVHKQEVSPAVIEMLAKADAWGQDVFKDIVRQIQLSEKEFSTQSIQKWVEDGKVSEDHAKALFKPIVVDS